jgi:hypothetical protein
MRTLLLGALLLVACVPAPPTDNGSTAGNLGAGGGPSNNATGVVQGTVLHGDGTPAPGALVATGGDPAYAKPPPDANGLFTLTLAAGDYMFDVNAGGGDETFRVTVLAGQTIMPTFQLHD